MPTYEYHCEHCGHRFEQFQQMSAKPLAKCPQCGRKPCRMIGSGAGIIFKGSGFYATDYKNKKKPSNEGTKPPPAATCPKANEACKGCQHAP